MNCLHGVRVDRDCWHCANEESVPNGEIVRLRAALQAAERLAETEAHEAKRLSDKLHAAERERDEARRQVSLMADSMSKAAHLAHEVHLGLIAERDEARAQLETVYGRIGSLVRELGDAPEDLAHQDMTQLELRAREIQTERDVSIAELQHNQVWIDHVRKQCGITGDRSIIELVQGLRAEVERLRLETWTIGNAGAEECAQLQIARDEARALAGHFVEQIIEMIGPLVVAELALEFYAAAETWAPKPGPHGAYTEIYEDHGKRARWSLALKGDKDA